MGYRADIAAVDPAGKVILVVEIKKKKAATREWARETYASIRPQVSRDFDYFMLASPEMVYLWDSSEPTVGPREFSVQELLAGDQAEIARVASHDVLEMTFYQWLTKLSALGPDQASDDIMRTGLPGKLRQATIEYEVAV